MRQDDGARDQAAFNLTRQRLSAALSVIRAAYLTEAAVAVRPAQPGPVPADWADQRLMQPIIALPGFRRPAVQQHAALLWREAPSNAAMQFRGHMCTGLMCEFPIPE